MAVIAQPYIDISGGRRYAAFPNKNLRNEDGTEKSRFDLLVDYTKTSGGAFRCLQFLARVTQLAAEILKNFGSTIAEFVKELAGQFAWIPLIITYLPTVTKDGLQALSDWVSSTSDVLVSRYRDTVDKIQKITLMIACWCYAGMLVTLGNKLLKNASDCFNLVSDVTDLQMATQDYMRAQSGYRQILSQPGIDPVKDRFVDTMRYSLIRMVKATASVASGIFGLSLLVLGGPTCSALVLIGISLLSTTMAIWTHFYKETATYEMVDFFKNRNPIVLVEGIRAH